MFVPYYVPFIITDVFTKALASTKKILFNYQAPLLDYLANAGCVRPLRAIRDRDLQVQDIVMFQVIHGVQGPFQRYLVLVYSQSEYGIEFQPVYGFDNVKVKMEQAFAPVSAMNQAPRVLTRQMIFSPFSPAGSNKRVAEEVVITYIRDYLQDVEGTILDIDRGLR